MKNKRSIRIIAVALLAIMMALSLASCAAGGKSVAKDASGDGWVYKKDGQTLTVTKFAEYEGRETPWKEVATSVKAVVIGNGITAIPDYAFYNMTALESVTFQGDITTVGQLAFAFTPALKEINLPESVTSVGYGAFEASGLVAVKVPAGVTVIEERTFAYCDDLSDVVGLGVGTIKSEAFAYCQSLKTLGIANVAAAADTEAIFGKGVTAPTVNAATVNEFKVVVKYLNESGEAVHEAHIGYYPEGTHDITVPAVDGYETASDKISVVVTNKDEEKTVTYTKIQEETAPPVESETAPVEDPEDDTLDPWTIVALVGTVVILVGLVVAVIIYVNHDKKKSSAKGQKKNKK